MLNSTASDRYWVNGSGVWSDTNHWSTTNGGNGGASIPTINDNVFFTSLSFDSFNQIVNLDVNASCASMSWKGVLNNPQFEAATGTTITLKGSLKLDATMRFDVKSDIYFKTLNNLGSTVYTAGKIIQGNIFIEADGGTVFLNDNLSASPTSSIYIVSGTLNTNNKDITCGSVVSKGALSRKFNLGTSTVTINKNWNLTESDNLLFDGNQSKIIFVDKLKMSNFQTAPVFHYGVVKSLQNSVLSHVVTAAQLDSNSCSTDCVASLVVTVTGGVGPYIYYWAGYPPKSTTATKDTLKNLCSGSYSLFVEDVGNGNEVIALAPDATVSPISPVGVVFFNNTSPSCNGGCNGKVTAVAGGGSGTYTYSWSNSITTALNNNICAGTYSITVTDKKGCTGTNTVVITQPTATNPNGTKTDVKCFAVCIGSASVAPTGGTGPYTYLWNNASTSASRSALCAGTYTVTITDNKGCTVPYTPTITQPAAALSATTVKTDIVCNNVCTGTSTITPAGGTVPYTYLWSNSATTSSLATLCAATYTCTVTDANGCTTTSSTTITEPPKLVSSPTGTNITCFGACNGTVNANASGGVTAYTYSWSPNGSTGATASSLCPATYTLTLTDANACTATGTVALTEPSVLAVVPAKTDVSCNTSCNGTVSAAPTGGTTPYTYIWSNGSTASTQFGQCAGSFTVTVIDANSCTTTGTTTIVQPGALTISASKTNMTCNGICDGTITTSTSGGTTAYTYSWSTGSTAANRTALCKAGYTVTVTDSKGCTATTSANITEPNKVTASISTTPVSCDLGCNGTAAVSSGGGTSPFTQVWSTAGTSATIGSLCAATYTVTVSDFFACTATSTATITQPAPLTLSLTGSNSTCFGKCDGAVTSTPGGGTSPYTYNWSSAVTTQNISGSCVGGYTLTVTDANACTVTSSVTLTAPVVLSTTVNSTNASCNTSCNGVATANPGGGTPTFTYAWSNSATGQTASALCAATYTVTVSDANNCQTTQTVTITQPTPLNASVVSTTTSCGLCNGTATANPSGGVGGYSYLWSTAQTSKTSTALCVASYTVTVTDSQACTATGTVVVSPSINITVTTSGTSLSCFGGCDGVATANASDGLTPYLFQWSNGSSSTTTSTLFSATGLCAQTYTVTVTDAGSCSNTATVTFVNPPIISPNANKTNATCGGVCDGTAFAAPSGGTGTYTYKWSTGATAQTISSLCPATYTVTITDSKACTQTATVTITEPTSLDDVETITPATCGFCDGKIVVNPTGGSAAYTYVWSNGGTAQTLSALCIGSYTLTLSAGGTCQSTFTYVISNIAGPTLTKARTNALCFKSCDGTASVTPAGTPGFTYLWTTGSTAATVNGLCFGTHTVTVLDGIGCSTVDTFLIKQPTLLDPGAVSADVTCGGDADGAIILIAGGGTAAYTYSWSTASTTSTITNLSAGSYTFTVTDANGCDTINTITITEPPVLSASSISTDVNCKSDCDGSVFAIGSNGTPGYSYSWSSGAVLDISINLCPNTYTCTVTDANGCTTTTTATVTEPASVLTTATGATNVSCNGGSNGTTFATPSGGTPGYSYVWAVGGQTGATATTLTAGNYNVTVTDANGCTATGSALVDQPTPITFTSTQVNVACNVACNGSLSVTASGGNGTFNYLWSNAVTGQTTTSLCAGGYTVTATDSKGCTNSVSFTITEPGILLANVSGTDPNCTSVSSGFAISSPGGGTTPFTYSWSNGSTAQTNSSLTAGTYTVTVTDKNGCTDSQTVTLAPSTPITIVQAVGDANCGVCNGTISVAPSGGTPAYTYAWNNGAATSSLTALCAANYTLTVTDVNTCTKTAVISVNNTGSPTGETITSTNDSCYTDCNGTATITPIGGAMPYTYSWTDIANTTNARTGMCVGTYTLAVTDANNCVRNASVTITEPAPFVFTPAVINASCSGKCDGSVTMSANGGTAPYTYSWSTGATGVTETLLCAATYTVTLTDANSCTGTTTVVIGVTQQLVPTVAQTNPLCNGLCTGVADITMNGGTNPYTYFWSNGVAVASSSGLCANTYTVSIVDANACNITHTITIAEPALLTITPTTTTATCGKCNGQIAVTPAGGTGLYSYAWGTGATSQTISAVCAGVYTLNVTDANGCMQPFSVPLNNTNGPSASTITKTDESCFGANDATATVSPNGGTPAYTYSWSTGQTTSSVTGLPGGSNLIQVTDANGCIRIDTVAIISPAQIVANQAVTNATCGASDGQIVVNASGGVAPYTYSWSTGSTATTISALSAATYDLTITDVTSCTQVFSIPVSNNNAPILSITVQNLGCNGVCNGGASVSPSGGALPYDILWSTAATGNTVSGLCAATYTVSVTDANTCMSISTVVVSEPSLLALSSPATQQTNCSLACTGSAVALPSGGTMPYSYLWSSGSTATTISNLCAGAYTVTTTDANSCTASQVITIVPAAAPFAVTPTVTNATCGACDGQAIVNVVGGTAPFTYLWSNAATGATATALCASLYSIDIEDASGCTASFFLPVSNVGGPTSTGRSITNITCNGQCTGAASVVPVGGVAPYTYLWLPTNETTQSIANLCAGMGFVQVTDSAGCVLTDTINITEPAPFAPNSITTQPSGCGVSDGSLSLSPTGGTAPYNYSWSNGPVTPIQSALGAGLYTVTITDALACAQSTVIAINNSTAPVLSFPEKGNVSCNGSCDGYAIVSVSGGVSPYTYLWNNSPASVSDTATGLCKGSYIVQVTDAAGCVISSTVSITQPNSLVFSSPIKNNASCTAVCNGSATALPAGGLLPYVYNWSTSGTSASVTNLCAAPYTLTVTDKAGCTKIQSLSISANPNPIVITSSIVNATCGVCNGQAAVTVVGGNLPHSYLWSSGTISQSDTGLCAGLQTVAITDGVGCQSNFDLPVSNLGAPTSSGKTITPASCYGSCDGTATLAPVGGVLPYTYNWIPGGQSISSATGLCSGLGFVQVTDSIGCILVDSIMVDSPAQINITATTVQPSSCTTADGSITLNVSGGAGTYTYAWSVPGTTSSQTNISAGAYGVTVTDATGCTQTSVITLNDFSAPTLSDSAVNVSCFGRSDGKATITAIGGTQPYTYSWNDILSTTIDTVKALAPGIYFVEVTDNIGCKIASSVSITEPKQLLVSLPTKTVASCTAVCNAIGTILPAGGSLPYTYAWSNAQTTATGTGLCEGTYTITVTDQRSCTVTQLITIAANQTPIVITSALTKATCNVCDGVAAVTVVGGSVPFVYLWSNGTTTATNDSLCAGLQTVAITDGVGCQSKFDLPISNTGAPTSTGKTITSASCYGICDGTATLAPVGGVSPYTYNWIPNGETTSSVTGLCSGLGFVQVADSSGCILVDSVLVGSPTQIDITAITVQPSSCSTADGSITLNVSGGAGSYTYGWNIFGNTSSQTNIPAGAYEVTITDLAGCTQTLVVALNDFSAPTLSDSVVNVSCFGRNDGKAIITAIGGTQPYTYFWNDILSTTIDTVKSLAPGIYFVEVTDNIGCKASSTVSITEASLLGTGFSNSVKEKCAGSCDGSLTAVPFGGTFPYTYSWSPSGGTTSVSSLLCSGQYTFTVTDAKGCTVQKSDSLLSPPTMAVLKTVVDANCNNTNEGSVIATVSNGVAPYTFAWTGPGTYTSTVQNISNLYMGNYPVTVTDANGCQQLDTVVVNATTNVIANAGRDTSYCEGSVIKLDGRGTTPVTGSTYKWLQMPSLTNVGNLDTVNIAIPVGTTNYMLIATNGVCSDSDVVIIFANPQPIVDAGNSQTIFPLNSIFIGGTPTSNAASPTFVWSPSKDLTDSTASNPEATPLKTTLYTVKVTDANGCTAKDTVTVIVIPEINFNNGLTPNGDGKNDIWMIDNISKFPKCEVEVYNRWGDMLFRSVGYGTPWDGKFKGADLPVGTYYYVIKLNDVLYPTPYTGPITIMR